MDNAATPDPPAESGNEWLNLREAARLLGYSTAKPIKAAIERGELRAYKSPGGRGFRVRRADLNRYVETHLLYRPQVQAAAPAPAARARRQTRPLSYTSQKKTA